MRKSLFYVLISASIFLSACQNQDLKQLFSVLIHTDEITSGIERSTRDLIFQVYRDEKNAKNNVEYKNWDSKRHEIQDSTEKAQKLIQSIENEFIEKVMGGINPEDRLPRNLRVIEETENFMLGTEGKKNGKAYELEEKLNNYAKFLNKFASDTTKIMFYPICSRHSTCMGGVLHPKADIIEYFPTRNFTNVTATQALMVLANLRLEVARYEHRAIQEITLQYYRRKSSQL